MKDTDWREVDTMRAAILRRHDEARAAVVAEAQYVAAAIGEHPIVRTLKEKVREYADSQRAFELLSIETRKVLRSCKRETCTRTYYPKKADQHYCSDNCRKRDYEARKKRDEPTEIHKRRARPPDPPAPEWSGATIINDEEG